MSEWQLIETAPTDGRMVLIANRKSRWVFIGEFVPRKLGDGREGPGWVTDNGDVSPTHWMPLPEPPK